MRKDIINIVADIVNSIDKTVKVRKIEDAELPNTKLFLECSFKWLKVGDLILDDQLRQATVTTINYDEGFITILKPIPNYEWDSKVFTIVSDIYYFKGTPLATNGEFGTFARNIEGKTPFVWLVNPTQEKFFTGESNNILERESELRLYFLDKTDYSKYTVQEHHDKVIKYLNAWVDGFFEAIKKDKRDFGKVLEFNAKSISKFGIETAQGTEKNILDANLSAVEIRFTLPIRKGAKCLC